MSLIGKTIGRYQIVEQLGHGGMAVVYKATDMRLRRDVALKVIRTEAVLPMHMERFRRRFEREATAQAKLTHPNIVQVYDYGEYDGVPYLVMEYVQGKQLKSLIGQKMNYSETARLLQPIGDALAYAHQQGVLHRDVKPSNILVNGKPMLVDFGIAKLLEGVEDGGTLTGTGMGVGTPAYMAPEQWKGEAFPQTDMYALGVVFYELVTGRKPYEADTPAAVAIKQATEEIERPRKYVRNLPVKVEKVLLKALHRDPSKRYKRMEDFTKILARMADEVETPSQAQPIGQRDLAHVKIEKPAKRTEEPVVGPKAIGSTDSSIEPTVDEIAEKVKTQPVPRSFWRRFITIVTVIALVAGITAPVFLYTDLFPKLDAEGEQAASLGETVTLTSNPTNTSISTTEHSSVVQATKVNPTPVTDPETTLTVVVEPAPESISSALYPEILNTTFAGPVPEGAISRIGKGVVRNIFNPPGGEYIIIHSSTGLYYYDYTTYEPLRYYDVGETASSSEISPDGLLIALGIEDRIDFFEISTGQIVDTFLIELDSFESETKWSVKAIDWTEDSTKIVYLVSEIFDSYLEVGVYDLTLGEQSTQIANIEAVDVMFSNDGHQILIANVNGLTTCPIQDAEYQAEDCDRDFVKEAYYSNSYEVFFSENEQYLFAFDNSNSSAKYYVFDVNTLDLSKVLRGAGTQVPNALTFSKDGSFLALSFGDGEVVLYRGQAWQALKSIILSSGERVPRSGTELMVFSDDSSTLYIFDSTAAKIRVFDLQNFEEIGSIDGFGGSIDNIELSPDGDKIAYSAGKIRIMDPSTFEVIEEWGPLNELRLGEFSVDGRLLGYGEYDMTYLVETDTWQVVDTIHSRGLIYFLADGENILIENTIYELNSARPLRSFGDYDNWSPPTSISNSPLYICFVIDNTVQIRNPESWSLIRSFDNFEDAIIRISLSPNGKFLTTFFETRGMRIHDVETSNIVFEIPGNWPQDPNLWVGQHDTAANIVFSPDSSYFAVGKHDGTVEVFDTISWDRIVAFEGHAEKVVDLAFSQDGSLLLSCSEDGTIVIWDIDNL